MSRGLHFDSIADIPERARGQVAEKLADQIQAKRAVSVAGIQEEPSASGNKYHNKKTVVDGISFDSRKEARRYEQLKVALELGVIEDLRLQVDFTLIEAYTDAHGERHQALRYKADFTYKVRSAGYDHLAKLGYEDVEFWRSLWPGALVIEDVKSAGTKTRVYINKKKM